MLKNWQFFIYFLLLHFSVSVCEANNNSWKCTTKTSPYQNDGWLDVFQPPKYSKDGNSFLQILPMKVGELHYPHIKFHNENDAKFITSGKFVVTSILIWNEEDSKVYFIGTGESSSVGPGSRHLYVAKTDTNVEVDCITCKLLTQRNQECLLNSILMSPDGQHYVHTCQGKVGHGCIPKKKLLTGSFIFILYFDLSFTLHPPAPNVISGYYKKWPILKHFAGSFHQA